VDVICVLQQRSGLEFTTHEMISTFIFGLDLQLTALLTKHHSNFPLLEDAVQTAARYKNGEKTMTELFLHLSLDQQVKSQKTGLGMASGISLGHTNLPSTINQINILQRVETRPASTATSPDTYSANVPLDTLNQYGGGGGVEPQWGPTG
jgi:hypothetical protein